MVRSLVRDLLQAKGYTVLEAAHGAEALRLCERYTGAIDLIVLDVIMPTMSGPELALRLNSTPRRPRLLFMSGYTANAILEHGLLTGSAEFLQKPFAPATLLRKVKEILGGAAQAASAV
jgi:DNA-binding response OmpR family regulator